MLQFAQTRTVVTPGGRHLQAARLRRGRRKESSEALADQEKLLGAAAIEQFAFFRALESQLLPLAVQAFVSGRQSFTPVVSPQLVNQHAARLMKLFASSRALGLVRTLDQAARLPRAESRGAATFAETLSGVPPKDAIRYLESLPAVTRSQWERFIRQAQGQAFTAAGIESQAALESLQKLIVESLRAGLTPEQFLRQAQELLREFQLSPHRLRTVWNTTVGRSMQEGRNAALEDPEVAALLSWGVFDAINDNVVRENHVALDGAVARREWWDAHTDLQPLLGFNCRCQLLWIGGGTARRFLAAGGPYFDIEAQGVPDGAGRDEGF